MSVYDYEKFLDKYDSDKAIKKFVDLRRKEKEKEIFRKIGLDEYFQPVTSVIRQELKPFHKLINQQHQQQIRDRNRDDGGWGDRQTERDMVDDNTDTINLDDDNDDEETIVKSSDIESLKNGKSTLDDDNEEIFSPLEKKEQQFFPSEIEQPSLDNPYDELKKSKFNKKSKEFADEWLKISKEELGYVKGQTNFNSYTRDDLVKYRENLKQMQTSSSKRISNKCIQQYDNDIKNQIKLINDKIGKPPINPRQKEIEEEKKYQKDVEENKKINQMFKQTKKKEGKGVKRGNNNNESSSSLIYYNNPQQLIDRLRLLVGSKRAGNTNPEIDSEIIGISDELVKKELINNGEYIRFMNKNFINY